MTENNIPQLKSDNPLARLAAARRLLGMDLSANIGEIRKCRRVESDSWVRAALDRAITDWEVNSGGSSTGESWISIPDETDLEGIRAGAIQEVTRTLLHEIRRLVGATESAARDELGENYSSSETRQSIGRIRDLLQCIQTLHDAAASPRLKEFDLADLVASEIAAGGFTVAQVAAMRTEPVIVRGDSELLRLAFTNVLLNAVEASKETRKQVVVNCGSDTAVAWISVLDEGIGLPEASNRVWEPGITKKDKSKHFGWGLPIAQRAAHSLEGSITLQPREHGGTSCQIRWPQNVRNFENGME